MFFIQTKLNTLQLQKDKGNDYVASWKSKGLYGYTLSQKIFLSHINLLGCKIGVKIKRDPLVVGQNKYEAKIVNANIVYELDTWPKTPLDNFTLQIACLAQLIL